MAYFEYDASVMEDSAIRRFKVLERALEMSEMAPEEFRQAAAKLFAQYGKDLFDEWTPTTLADLAVATAVPVQSERYQYDPDAVEVVADAAFLSTDEWEKIRMDSIGGSESAAIHHCSSFTSEHDLWETKTGRAGEKETKAVFERGHALEDTVIDKFCKMTGAVRLHETRMFRSKSHRNVTANPDEIVRMPDGSLFIFEAKTSASANRYKWFGDAVPPYYWTQMRHYLAVMNDEHLIGCYIGCLFVDDIVFDDTYMGSSIDIRNPAVAVMGRDADAERDELDDCQEWWEEAIIADEEPPAERDVAKTYETAANGMASVQTVAETELLLNDIVDPKAIRRFREAKAQYETAKAAAKIAEDSYKEEKAKMFDVISAAGGAADAYLDADDPNGKSVRFRPATRLLRSVNYDALSIVIQELKLKAPELVQALQDCFTSTETHTVDVRDVRRKKK